MKRRDEDPRHRDQRSSQLPRRVAWQILQAVERGGYADALLGSAFARGRLSRQDRSLVARLVYGTLAWQGTLDFLLAGFSAVPLQELDAPIRVLLRMALFQIVKLDRIPPFAAVSTAVELAKSYRGGKAAAYVNAVLRRAATGWTGVPLPARERDLAGHLSVRWSHPRWLVELWLSEYGAEETEALLAANNEAAPTVLRINCMRQTRSEFVRSWNPEWGTIRETRYSPVGVEIRGGDPTAPPAFLSGQFTVQGEAEQIVAFLVAPRSGERVLDLCAAPGGKTTHLAELMGDQGEVVAVDRNEKGVQRIRSEAKRLGLHSVRAEQADARFWSGPTGFDRVLLDAPCSGLGTLRQHPEIRWRRRPDELPNFAALQKELLVAASHRVRFGGIIVYATCTLTRAENEEVIAEFLAQAPQFVVDNPVADLPPQARSLVGPDGFFRTLPHRHGSDGFFAVRLRHAPSGDIVRG